ncbi:MAG: acyl carrier protein [Kiritimatiellae bacterium]|nr:acyl carrier protein [Kiritimatiellia bacterium]
MENKFLEFVSSVFGVQVSDISLDTSYMSLPQWDSVMHLRLVLEIESKYGVKYSIEEVPRLMTLRDFFNAVRKKEFLSEMGIVLENSNVNFETVLADIDGWCSLMAFSVLIMLECKFSAVLSITEFVKCKTIGDVAVAAQVGN